MRIVVTGKTGQVAAALLEVARGSVDEIIPVGRPELNLLRPASILPTLEAAAPDVIVSAAAYTLVDQAEHHPDLAFRSNGIAPGHVGRAASALGVPVVHLSSDYVFDGRKAKPYLETDPTNPINVYGSSKLRGEYEVRAAQPWSAVLRTSWVYSPFGTNFLVKMVGLVGKQDHVSVVADQIGNPTNALDLAAGCLCVARNLAETGARSGANGIFHMAGATDASWADLAEEVFSEAAKHGRRPTAVHRIASRDLVRSAKRPADTRLNCDRLAAVHGVRLPEWRLSVAGVVSRILAGHPA